MDFKEYQDKASTTAIYPGRGTLLGVSYVALGLSGEAGEVANKVKKVLRGDFLLEESKEAILDEVGDVLWYLSEVSSNLGESLECVARRNIEKLQRRQENKTLQGSGDHR